MKKGLIVIGSILIVLVVGMIFLVNKMDRDVEVILNTDITEINLSLIEDGIYIGEYKEALMVKATVEVTVTNHEITDIRILEHDNGKGDAAEVITTDFINEQSVMVDDVAGATISSRVLKLAVIDAFKEE